MRSSPRESSIEKYFREQVEKHGGIAYKFVSPGNPGVPDRIVIFAGMVHFVELKAAHGVLRSAQKIQKKRLAALGFDVSVIRSKDQARLWVQLTASMARFISITDEYIHGSGSGKIATIKERQPQKEHSHIYANGKITRIMCPIEECESEWCKAGCRKESLKK